MRTVIVKTPLRLPLGGGGTDLPAYVKEHGGFIFGAAIDKYVYVTATHSPLHNGIFVSVPHEEQNEIKPYADAVKNTLVREALRLTGWERGLAISSASDIMYGTGLGSSGAFLVGLLHALYAMRGSATSKEFLAERASHIFINHLGSAEGKQDPYLASMGGFTCFELGRDNKVHFQPLAIAPETEKEFEARSLYFYSGARRESAVILKEHERRARAGDESVLEYRHRVKEIGREVKAAFEQGDMDRFGELLHEHWQAKKKSSSGMSVGIIDGAYDDARASGMMGGKLMGAGGGGFFMAFVKDGCQDAVRGVFARVGADEVSFKISRGGSEIIFDSGDDSGNQNAA
ncbi:MAG: galactokinase [Patescibacteria group bacterium]